MEGLTLTRCSSDNNSLRELERERIAVRSLEDVVAGATFSMVDLERCYLHAISSITRIMVAALIEKASGDDFEQIEIQICGMAENDALCQNCIQPPSCQTDVPLKEVISWTNKEDCESYEQATIIVRFAKILTSLESDYMHPCDTRKFINGGFARWDEVRNAAKRFMTTRTIRLSEALELIHFLRRRPYLNMMGSSGSAAEEEISLFDKKHNRLRLMYPIIDTLTDPAVVVVDPVGGGAVPPQIAGVVHAITTATLNPLPSGVPPHLLGDPAGPQGTTFSTVFEVQNLTEARIFASMLRGAVANGNGGGGPGPATRILVMACPAMSFRIY